MKNNLDYLLNYLNKEGNKAKGRKILLEAFALLKKETLINGFFVFNRALENSKPSVYIKNIKKRRGRKKEILIMPISISLEKKIKIGVKWLLEGAIQHDKKNLSYGLFKEIMDAYNNKGYAINKKKEIYKKVIENKFRIKKK